MKINYIPDIGLNNYNNRRDWIIRQIQSLPVNSRLLDAGAGTQYFRQFCKHLDYVAQDFADYIPDPDADGLQNPNWNYGELDIVSDITQIPEPDSSFDVILCSEVLEHLPEPNKAIQEFSRLLKRGGVLILTAPFCSLTHQSPYFFTTGFSRFYYEETLAKNGFANIVINANGSFFEYIAQENRRLNWVAKKYSGVKLTLYQRIVSFLFLRILNSLNKKDISSNELLCFGYFVKALNVKGAS